MISSLVCIPYIFGSNARIRDVIIEDSCLRQEEQTMLSVQENISLILMSLLASSHGNPELSKPQFCTAIVNVLMTICKLKEKNG